jgi:protein SCO1/2
MKTRSSRGFANRSTLMVMIAALAAGLGLYLGQKHFEAPADTAVTAVTAAQLKSVRLIQPARVLPAYQLQASDGSAITPATLAGHWTVVFLGFTHCPDVCPTTLAELAKAQKQWAALPAATRPRVLFVSVDPERDSPAKTGEYAHFFHPDTLAAGAPPAALANFAHAIGLVYGKVGLEHGDYSMDHSATLVVLDPQAREAGLIRPPLRWQDIAADLRLLSAGAP